VRRLITAPSTDFVSAREAARWLGIGTTLLKELIASGDFPPPIRLGRRKAQRWYWLDIVAWGHLRSINRREKE
jgi:predicted DNA-binding transcriptional regulator AlpA